MNSTDAWLLTGGTHIGIMKIVGDAVNKGQHMVQVSNTKVLIL